MDMSYIGIVRFTLCSMCDLALEDKSYSFDADLQHYYDNEIYPKKRLSPQEFYDLVKEVTTEKGVHTNIRLVVELL